MATPCTVPIRSVCCENGITANQKATPSALSAGRQGRMLHGHSGSWIKAFQERGGSGVRSTMRLRERMAARSAIADQKTQFVRLLPLSRNNAAWIGNSSALSPLAGDDRQMHEQSEQFVQELRRARDYGLRALGDWRGPTDGLRMFLEGHGGARGRRDNRATGQRSRLFSFQLLLADAHNPKPQPPFAENDRIPGRVSSGVGVGGKNRDVVFYVDAPDQVRMDSGGRAHPPASQIDVRAGRWED